jgi:hypothetical protein
MGYRTNRERTGIPRNYSKQLISLILPITIELQSTVDEENKVKKAAMILAAKFKSTAITTATEATAIAIEEISTGIANTNMEQHINKLIEATLKKQTSEKPKTSQGKPSKTRSKKETPKQQKSKPWPSRRKEERRKKREWKEKQEAKVRQEHQLTLKPYNDIISNAKLCCTQDYSFASDPNKPLWENIPNALKTLLTQFFLQTPTNLWCHNLCKNITLPPGYNQLLGLGLNYYIKTIHPNPNIKITIVRMEKLIWLKHWIDKHGANNNNDDYIPSLYTPTKWKPPEAPSDVENTIKK